MPGPVAALKAMGAKDAIASITSIVDSINGIVNTILKTMNTQPKASFIAGGVIANKSETDFEVTFWRPIRGSWESTEVGNISSLKKIYNEIATQVNLEKLAGPSDIRTALTENLLKNDINSVVSQFSCLTNGIGFKGIIELYSEMHDISILLYIGKLPNLSYKAGAWIGSGRVTKHTKPRKKTLGVIPSNWANYIHDTRFMKHKYPYVKVSFGKTKTCTYKGFNVKFTAGQKVDFQISGGQSPLYGQHIALRTYQKNFLEANTNKVIAKDGILGANDLFVIENISRPDGPLHYADLVRIRTNEGKYLEVVDNKEVKATGTNPDAENVQWRIFYPNDRLRPLRNYPNMRGPVEGSPIMFQTKVYEFLYGVIKVGKYTYLTAFNDGKITLDDRGLYNYQSFNIVTPLGFHT